MTACLNLGDFDLDITLKDAASDAASPEARRDLARACIGTDAFEAFYVTYELTEVLRAEHEGVSDARTCVAKLAVEERSTLGSHLIEALSEADHSVSVENAEWLLDILKARVSVASFLLRRGEQTLR